MTLDGTRSFVIGRERCVVVDPGPADETHIEALVRTLEGVTPMAILLTHAHADHAAGAPMLAERTGAPIRLGRGAPRMPFDAAGTGRCLEDGELLETDSGPLQAIATPGHAREHFAFLLRSQADVRAVFAGDLFLGVGDTTLVSAPNGNVADYLVSLAKIAALRPTWIFPAHGRALRDPESVLERYRRHRLERVAEVRRVLRERPDAGPEELMTMVYGGTLDPRLRRAAVGSVEAVLEYLGCGATPRPRLAHGSSEHHDDATRETDPEDAPPAADA